MNFQQKINRQKIRMEYASYNDDDDLQIIVDPPKTITTIFQQRKKENPKSSSTIYHQFHLHQQKLNTFKTTSNNYINELKLLQAENEKRRTEKQRQEKMRIDAMERRIRDRRVEKEREREREKERIKERQKHKSIKQQSQKHKQADLLLLNLIGSTANPTKKIKPNENQGLRNLELIQKLDDDQDNEEFRIQQQPHQKIDRRKHKWYPNNQIPSLNKVEQPDALIKLILSHQFSANPLAPERKRIPNIFRDKFMYKKTFHYLLANECLADIDQRIRKLQKSQYSNIRANILSYRKNNDGLLEIMVRQIVNESEKDVFLLKNLSLSRNRLGIITTRSPFTIDKYGVPSKDSHLQFAFIVLLSTPETKQQLNSDVKVVASIKQSQLEMILTERKSNEVYFVDFEKMSTHLRQYLAVANLHLSQLSQFIYNPLLVEKYQFDLVDNRQILQPILEQLKGIFNRIQFESIKQMVVRQYGIVLLQGPPGTGKTSTLLGLLSAQYEYFRRSGEQRKILICAPSNAAIDHITKRIMMEGLYDGAGSRIQPKILRLGIIETTDKDIKSVSLDQICERIMLEVKKQVNSKYQMSTPEIKDKIVKLQKQMKKLLHERRTNNNSQIDDKVKQKSRQIISYENLLYQFRRSKVEQKNLYNQIQKNQIDTAQIILTTLSSSGTDKMDRIKGKIGCLIVDEAAQATQPNLLIPLQTGVQKVLLIGDPYQLPATTMSTDSSTTLFNRSLFERFLDAGIKPYFLNIQYRMAALIRQFPSNKFYQGRLEDGQNIMGREMHGKIKPFANRNTIFIDIPYSYEKFSDNSYDNKCEAQVVKQLLAKFNQKQLSIGVITPYQAQRKLISRMMDKQGMQIQANLMINTVDSFQGQQKDIIIISCVRSNDKSIMGFMIDERRINVALTRAKHLMIVVGRANTLASNQIWNQFLQWAESKNSYYRISKNGESDKVIEEMLNGPCMVKFQRKKYAVLTQDLRKNQRIQIEANDFLKKKNKGEKKKHNKQEIKKEEKVKIIHQVNEMEIEQVLEQRQMKIDEGIRIEQINKNVTEIEKKIKSGQVDDSFLKMLLG